MQPASNRLFPMIGIAAVAIVLFVVLRPRTDPVGGLTTVPQATTPDADSPADTVRSLAAKLNETNTQLEEIRRENQELLAQRTQIADDVRRRLESDLAARPVQDDGRYQSLLDRIEDLSRRVQGGQAGGQAGLLGGGEVDLDDDSVQDIRWVEPLGGSVAGDLAQRAQRAASALRPDPSSDTGSLLQGAGGAAQAAVHPPEPVYTVPRNATLLGSTSLTALVGRVPRRGQVEDPFPFKVLVGGDNLAANGLKIPGVDGMVVSGTAVGDWTLGCVRGTVDSVTFVFDDGTIRTVSDDGQAAAGTAAPVAAGGAARRGLGYLSDRRGIPCVSGRRISNATTFLAGRFLARSAEAAGDAIARAQTTTTVAGGTGTSIENLTGDTAGFLAGNALSGGAEELAAYLRERQADQFDVVYVDTGQEVAIHIDREIPIDFDPNGRRLDHGRASTSLAGRGNLD